MSPNADKICNNDQRLRRNLHSSFTEQSRFRKVERALFSKQARQLIRRSTDHASSAESRLEGVSGRSSDYGAVGKGVNTVRLRQRIITQLVDEGRGMVSVRRRYLYRTLIT